MQNIGEDRWHMQDAKGRKLLAYRGAEAYCRSRPNQRRRGIQATMPPDQSTKDHCGIGFLEKLEISRRIQQCRLEPRCRRQMLCAMPVRRRLGKAAQAR